MKTACGQTGITFWITECKATGDAILVRDLMVGGHLIETQPLGAASCHNAAINIAHTLAQETCR